MKNPFKTAISRSLSQVLGGEPTRAADTIKRALGTYDDTAAARNAARSSVGRSLEKTLEALRNAPGASLPSTRRQFSPPTVPEGASFEHHRFSGPEGGRDYWVYVPTRRQSQVQGVVMMLHGCTQTALDFAVGTRMNEEAEKYGFAVVYPEQTSRDNSSSCWNWFRRADQRAGSGEPALLTSLVLQAAEQLGAEAAPVFVAGLSAGGAMAAILGDTYPEVFRAVGVHSGLAPGSAHDVASAFGAMQGKATSKGTPLRCPAIVLHGSLDKTVARSNAERICGRLDRQEQRTTTQDGRRVVVTFGRNESGKPCELWMAEGAGHAWFGGSAEGTYTDQRGPNASAEIMRFFLRQR